MTFKKDSIIVSSRARKKGGKVTVIWLKEDYTPGKDDLIWYHNYYHLRYKKRRRNVIDRFYPEWKDNVGGSLNYFTSETWHLADKEIIKRVKQVEEYIRNKKL